ncbi:UDP-N-acetylmuramoyl-tripeptide--D-alanyl-D-alanine ligase [Nocardioides pyridinolyticus]
MTLAEIAELVGGSVHGDGEIVVSGPAYVDSRKPEADGLFVAVVGEHVDGHAYAAGAHAVLGSRPTEAPTVVVEDPVVALGRLAGHVARRLPATLLAMTGSQGKTGTKDYLAHVLAAEGPTVATVGSLNNELGLPLTVLRADADTRFLVLEMGARGIGHIAYLCEIAPPRIAAVLNVGTAHVGEFGSREAIALAKGEIVEVLPEDGVAVLNAGDDLVTGMSARTRARVLRFGTTHGDVLARGVEVDDLSRPSFELGVEGSWHPVRLRQSGVYQVQNALAAATMAVAAGVPLDRVAAALSTAEESSPMRMELHERADGLLVINDAYNANPASMTAALEALMVIGKRRGRRTIAVLGEMRELGDQSRAGHQEVGHTARLLGIDTLVVVGEAAAALAEGYASEGSESEAILTAGRAEALAWVRENAAGSDVVLVKASRGAALELIADGLLSADPDIDSEGGSTTP